MPIAYRTYEQWKESLGTSPTGESLQQKILVDILAALQGFSPPGSGANALMTIATTTAGEDEYTHANYAGMTAGNSIVLYGSLKLETDQWSVTGTTLTINPGLPIEAGFQLVTIKQV